MKDRTLLKEQEVAELIGISVTRLQHMRGDGEGPPFVRIGRSVRYPARDLADWCDTLPRWGSTGSAGNSDGHTDGKLAGKGGEAEAQPCIDPNSTADAAHDKHFSSNERS